MADDCIVEAASAEAHCSSDDSGGEEEEEMDEDEMRFLHVLGMETRV